MPLTWKEKYFMSQLIWRQNHSKLCKQNFIGSLTEQLSPEKPNLSLGIQILSHRVSKQPQQEARKFQIWQEVDCKMSWQCGWGKRFCQKEFEKSLQRLSQELGLSHALLQRILKKILHFYPYRIQIKHKFTAADMEKLLVMRRLFENEIEEDPDFLDDVWFSEEAHFWLCGYVNSNCWTQSGHQSKDSCHTNHVNWQLCLTNLSVSSAQ